MDDVACVHGTTADARRAGDARGRLSIKTQLSAVGMPGASVSRKGKTPTGAGNSKHETGN